MSLFFNSFPAEKKVVDSAPTNSALIPSNSLNRQALAAKAALAPTDLISMNNVANGVKGKKKKGKTSKLKIFRDGIVFNNTGRPPLIRPPANNAEFRFVQSYEVFGWHTASNAAATFIGQYFTASSLDQISALTSVFDQYKIERIEVWIIPRISTVASNAGANTGLFHTVIDFDDATALTTLGQALDYTNCTMSSGSDGHYRTWVPHAAVASYSGAFTSYANVEAPWIDAVSTSVQHYGIKTAWSTCDLNTYTMDLVVRLHTAWRNIR